MNKADELIACLEGGIAKRDARIVELERYQFAFNEWHDKTEWVQAESATLSAKYLGCHRADVMRSLIDGLRAELAALKAQGTVGEVVGWYRLDRPYEMTSYPSVCATWHKLGAPVAPLYAAPVQQVSVPDAGKLADAFISWKLPASVRPDGCAMDTTYPHRYGTNLLTWVQAKEMFEYVLASMSGKEVNDANA